MVTGLVAVCANILHQNVGRELIAVPVRIRIARPCAYGKHAGGAAVAAPVENNKGCIDKIMKIISAVTTMVFSVFCLLAVAGIAHAKGGDAKLGKDKAALCAGCHGDDGNSMVADFPRLAGQYESYIVKQVRDFQSGHRANNETMAGMAATVASVQDAKDIGAYFSSKKMAKQPLTDVDKKLVAKGKKLFEKGNPLTGVYACINCHGARGKGKSKDISVFPRIGGQHRDYLIKELKDFRAGRRANDPAGMMTAIARKITDKEIMAVANYLSAQLP